MESCPICCEKFTLRLRKPITCKFCEFQACTSCVKTYLLNIITDPKCMKCEVGWDPEFIDSVLSNNFRSGELKKHREIVLFDRERALMPSTSHLVERRIEAQKKEILVSELFEKKLRLREEISNIEMQMYDLGIEIAELRNITLDKTVYTKKAFVRGCPGEGCRGFLNSEWKCGICEVQVCAQCHEIKSDTAHECKPENIASAKLLMKDSKPCPSCAAQIFKINGCNQMFCTMCNTAFDWITGKIQVNNIHNPHYYEWLRKNGEAARPGADAVVCADTLPEFWQVYQYLKQVKVKFDFSPIHRGLVHIYMEEMHRYPVLDVENMNTEYRIKYMMNEISEEELRKLLLKNENKNIKNRTYRQVFEMVYHVGIDLFHKVLRIKNAQDVEILKNEFEQLRLYFNESMVPVSRRFNSKIVKQLTKDWYVDSVNIAYLPSTSSSASTSKA